MNNNKIHTRLVLADEAQKLQGLLRRCYCEGYFDSLYYDVNSLAEALRYG